MTRDREGEPHAREGTTAGGVFDGRGVLSRGTRPPNAPSSRIAHLKEIVDMPKTLAALLSAGALALTVAACGGSSSNSSSSTAAAAGSSSATSSATTSQTAAAGAAGSSHLKISANPSGSLMFSTTHLSAKAGTVTITFTNKAPEGHNFTLATAAGKQLAATPTFDGGSKTVTVKLTAGKYMYMCTVPGHAQGGMMGTLTVT
jgi:plastocyanin